MKDALVCVGVNERSACLRQKRPTLTPLMYKNKLTAQLIKIQNNYYILLTGLCKSEVVSEYYWKWIGSFTVIWLKWKLYEKKIGYKQSCLFNLIPIKEIINLKYNICNVVEN